MFNNWFSIRKVAVSFAVIGILAGTLGVSVVLAKTEVSRVPVNQFQAAGAHGGGVLNPDDFFPPTNTNSAYSKMQRGDDWVQYEVHTNGLPPGAYTTWWVVFNEPGECANHPAPCIGTDLDNSKVNASIFWSTGGIVRQNRIGNFQDRHTIGDSLGGPGQFLFGPGLLDSKKAEIHIVIKYHGPASDDPDDLEAQTTTVDGLCDSGANSYGDDACFDPQSATHQP